MKQLTADEFTNACIRIIRGEYTAEEREGLARGKADRAYEERKRPRLGLGTQGHRLRAKEARRA